MAVLTTSAKFIKPALPALTGLRGVAALWVLLYHLSLSAAPSLLDWAEISDFSLLSFGWMGVTLFFMLSGFSLMYFHGSDFRCFTTSDMRRFRLQRAIRVYPLSWAVLAIIFCVGFFDHAYWQSLNDWSVDGSPREALARTVLLGTAWLPGRGSFNQPAWSLSAEIVGYMFFPVIAIHLNRLHRGWIASVVAGISLIFLFFYESSRGTININEFSTISAIPRMGFSFIAGSALGRLRLLEPIRLRTIANTMNLIALAIVLLSTCILQSASLLPAGFALIILSTSYETGLIERILRSRPAIFLGQISFPMYLIHVQVLTWMQVHQSKQTVGLFVGALMLVAYLIAVVFLSLGLFYWVEKPTHRLAKSLYRPSIMD